MVIIDLSANETKARAYSQQGHGKQHKPIQRPDTYQRLPEDMQLNTCEQQPVHTFGLEAALRRCSSPGCMRIPKVAILKNRIIQRFHLSAAMCGHSRVGSGRQMN